MKLTNIENVDVINESGTSDERIVLLTKSLFAVRIKKMMEQEISERNAHPSRISSVVIEDKSTLTSPLSNG